MSVVLDSCRSSLVAAARLAQEFDQWGMSAASHGVRQVASELAQAIERDERALDAASLGDGGGTKR